MRRFLSITVILALFSSMLSPMAAACTGTGKAVSCHAVAVDHCDRPMHGQHHHHGMAAPQSKTAFSAAPDETKCPMDCCTPGHLRSGATISTHPDLPPPAVSDLNIQFFAVVFTVAGFSSHTDRGPPLV
jgi:hypothetical protein